MTRRFLPAWILTALLATTAMMPTAANAQSISTQGRFRSDQNIRPRVSNGANTYGNTWSSNQQPTYRQPLVSQPRVSHRFFSTTRTRSHRTVWTWGRNDRRR
jgi:hypothetical protein